MILQAPILTTLADAMAYHDLSPGAGARPVARARWSFCMHPGPEPSDFPRTAPFDRDPPGGGEGSLPNHLLRAASDRDPQVVPGLPTLISKAHGPGPVLERPGAPGARISEGLPRERGEGLPGMCYLDLFGPWKV